MHVWLKNEVLARIAEHLMVDADNLRHPDFLRGNLELSALILTHSLAIRLLRIDHVLALSLRAREPSRPGIFQLPIGSTVELVSNAVKVGDLNNGLSERQQPVSGP